MLRKNDRSEESGEEGEMLTRDWLEEMLKRLEIEERRRAFFGVKLPEPPPREPLSEEEMEREWEEICRLAAKEVAEWIEEG